MTFQSQFPGVAEAVAREFDCEPSELLTGGRLESLKLSEARAVAAWLAYQTGTVSFPVLGRMLGMQYPATRARVMAVARRREREPKFMAMCERLAGRSPMPVASHESYAKIAGGSQRWTGISLPVPLSMRPKKAGKRAVSA